MLLINEKLPNHKFCLGRNSEVSTDGRGVVEIKDTDVIESFLASGFVKFAEKGKKAALTEEPVEPQSDRQEEEPAIEEPVQEKKPSRFTRKDK